MARRVLCKILIPSTSPPASPNSIYTSVGDTPADIHCAQSINAPVLAVATGNFTEGQLAEHHPTFLAPDLTSVPLNLFDA